MANHEDQPARIEDHLSEAEFIEWLDGMEQLALLGSQSRSSFLDGALKDMGNRGMTITPERLALLMTRTFGSLDNLVEELRGMPMDAFTERYPSISGIVAPYHQGSRSVGDDLPQIGGGVSELPSTE